MESKKRVFSEPEVIEISPPVADRMSNVKAKGKQKEVFYHEIIDVDMDEDCKDVVLLEGKVDSRKKRKGSTSISLSSSSSAKFDSTTVASNNKGKSALRIGLPAVIEAPVSGLPDLVTMKKDTPATPFVTSNTQLKASVSQPKRVDPMLASTMFSSSVKSTAVGVQSTYYDPKPSTVHASHSTHIGSSNYLSNSSNTQVGSGASSFSQPKKVDPVTTSTVFSSSIKGTAVSGQSTYFDPKPALVQTTHSNFTHIGSRNYLSNNSNTQVGSGGSSFSQPKKVDPMTTSTMFSSSIKSIAVSGQSTYFDPKPAPVQTTHSNFTHIGSRNYSFNNSNTQVGSGASSFSQPKKVDPVTTSTMYSSSNKSTAVSGQSYFDPKPAPGMASSMSKRHESFLKHTAYPQLAMNTADMLSGAAGIYSMNDMFLGQDATVNDPSSISMSSVESSSSKTESVHGDVKKRYESFKKFDTVGDHSDHHYVRQSSTMRQPPKNWAKKIQEEWKILEKDLPDTIFVRVYESRMDLLRAVIIGAEGTPYHDGLFFFDVCFPSSYPNTPPLVHYHSGGLRINPNLYNCGKVCLSLLNTWTGVQNEKWVPGTSTMLQVLVSIQGLILNMKPYFNEPGYAHSSGSVHGEKSSLQYNENTLILSLKTMVYTMNKPPKHFEDLVIGHFQHRVHDILMACKAYTEGVQVGCLVKGGVQDVDEGDNSCSAQFKDDVCSYIKTLVAAFEKIGAKKAQEFLYLSAKKSSLPAAPSLGLSLGSSPSPNPTHTSYPSNGYPPYPFNSIPAAYNPHW